MAKKRNKNHRPHETSAPAALHVPADVAPQPPAPLEQDEVRLLREALQAERSARASLELRLRSLEEELQSARRPRPTPTSAVLTPEDLGAVTLHAMAAPAKPSADDRAFFESWVIEANMRADAALAAHTVPSAPSLIPVIAEGRPSLAESTVAQDRLLRKLSSAREALDTAEAKAAHNAAQVKKLTAELAAARAEHMRTTTRLRGLEARLAQAEGQPPAPISSPALEPSRPEAAPAARVAEHPFTDLAALPPIHRPAASATTVDVEDALAAWGANPAVPSSPAQNVAEDFDVLLQDTPGATSDLGEALAQWGNDLSAAPTPNLEDALAAWGTEAKAAPEPATPALEDALAAWGAEEKSSPETATPGLEDALADWGALGDTLPAPVNITPPAAPMVPHDAPSGPVDSLPQIDAEDTPDEPEEEPASAPAVADSEEDTVVLPGAPMLAEASRSDDVTLDVPEAALPATDIEFLNDLRTAPTPAEPVISPEITEDGFVLEAPVELAVEDEDDDGIEFIEDTLEETATAEEAADALAAELLAEHRANADTVLLDDPEPAATPESEAAGIDFLEDTPAPAATDEAQSGNHALDLDDEMPEGAHDIAFETPVETAPEAEAADAPEAEAESGAVTEPEEFTTLDSTPDGPDAEDNARALEDALEEVYGTVEAATPEAADAQEAPSLDGDDIEEIAAEEPLPDESEDEDDFTPEPQDATPVAGPPSEEPYESLTAAYQHHHKDDEREALLARSTRIMEAGRQHSVPRARSVAASLESWSGFGNPPARAAAPRATEPVVSREEEHALEPAEDTGGRATMVDALLRFMRPK